ncbi:bicyclogermacrene synthase-like [Salvia divinorum]|uniref:Bicyclogermacrene synthase-like n=1 Tax=Salvia divinorum TaxID=28513 RepID=A0ABD1HGE4_SALDI
MKNGKSLDEIRKSATFHPSIWGDFFLKYDSDNTKITDAEQEELAKHKEMRGEIGEGLHQILVFKPIEEKSQEEDEGITEVREEHRTALSRHTHTQSFGLISNQEVFARERAVIGVEISNLWNLSERGIEFGSQ